MTRLPDRREFVAAAAAAAGLAALSLPASASPSPSPAAPSLTILFQGDSITDAGRTRDVTGPNLAAGLGAGYPYLIAAAQLARHPERGFRFFDRGVSGNKIPDLAARWQSDTLALAPDVLSVLMGVNDFWHRLLTGYAGTVQDFETGYTALLESARQARPGVRLVVLEPFALRTGAVDARWFPEFDQRRAAAARVARAVRATFIPLQAMFDRLIQKVPPAWWAADGVHPTPAGHAAIAAAWQEAVRL